MQIHRNFGVIACIVLVACAAGMIGSSKPAQSMPNFGQAYGVQCSECHTQIPALNAYGRYVQRTGYSALNPHVLIRESPIWLDFPITYSQQTPSTASWVVGNVGFHADGGLGTDLTYHVQQWIWKDNIPGPLDTMWVAYNKLLNREGHLFVGKLQVPAPSEFSQWFDVTGLTANAAAEMTVGEHTYQLDANRWGTKFAYVANALDAEVAYVGSTGDLDGWTQWGWDQDKTLQYKLAYANRSNPLEFGYYGARGSWPLSEGGFDQYYANAFYIQRDPVKWVPGFIGTYQTGYDGNPGMGASPAASNGAAYEFFENVGPRAMISVGEQFTNDGMGTHQQIGNIDVSYHVTRFIQLYAEEAMSVGSKPTWNGLIWFFVPTGPLWPNYSR